MRSSKRTAFTLIELLVTIAITAILASVAFPAYQGYIAKQRMSGGQSDLVSLALNLENYLQNNTQYPAPANGVGAIQAVLPGWVPAQQSDFSYAITAVSNTAAPPTYTVQAVGNSASVGDCVLTLTSAGIRTMARCPSGSGNW